MSIKVLHVLDHLGFGGAPMSVKNIIENTHNKNFELFVCALRSAPTAAIQIKGNVTVLKYGKYDPRSIWAITRLCKKNKIDILHAHLQKSIIGCLLISYFYKAPVIVHERGAIFRRGLVFSLYRFFLRILHHRSALIIANSKATARELVQKAGVNRNKIKVIYNAIDFSSFDGDGISRSKARKKFGISDTDTVIGFVGRLRPVKGVDLLIEAFALLSRQSGDHFLLLAADGPLRKSLEKLAEELGVSKQVKFLGTLENTAEVIATFDVAAVPSRQESFGRVALELMRMKVPIVSSGADGLAELVHDGQTGIVTQVNSPEEICRGVERLLRDANLRKRLTETAYAFTEQFGIKEHVNKLGEIYMDVLNDVN